jgi:hypothetical protein
MEVARRLHSEQENPEFEREHVTAGFAADVDLAERYFDARRTREAFESSDLLDIRTDAAAWEIHRRTAPRSPMREIHAVLLA